jgi:hypothetical protein
LIQCYQELKNTKIRKVIVNYEWSQYTKNELLKEKNTERRISECKGKSLGKKWKCFGAEIKPIEYYDEYEVA